MKSSKGKSFVTIGDLARELGVSTSTVSRALRDHHDVNPETRQRVLELANRLNYRPNPVALSLLNQRTRILGVVVPEIANPFFSAAISGIESEVLGHGYQLFICQSNERADRERALIDQLFAMRVEGLVISVSAETTSADYFSQLLARNFPIVFFDRSLQGALTHKVIIDDYQGAFQATTHLLEQGCTQVVHMGGPQHLGIARSRYEGYLAALAQAGIKPRPEWVRACKMNPESAQAATEELLAEGVPFDGLFAINDRSAIGAAAALKAAGRRIPDDVALVGFGNLWLSGLLDPPLSSVAQPATEMGRTAASYLLQLTQEPEVLTQSGFMARVKVMPTELIARTSSLRRPA